MGRILSEKGGPSPKLAGPSEADSIPEKFLIDGEIPTWAKATHWFTSFVEYLENESVVAHKALNFAPFTQRWAGAAWSELYRVDQKACRWAESTVLIEFSGSYWLDKDSKVFLPPVTFLTALQSSKSARQKALSRTLSDLPRWQSIRVIGGEGHNGYPRVFLGLYLPVEVDNSFFEPVLDAHLNNCLCASLEAHILDDTVSINGPPSHKSRLIHSLGDKVPGLSSGSGIRAESWEKRKIATALHAGGCRPYSFGRSI
ncbi:hypothetical protein [Haloarcula brevis]|uniref:hypothetical protein n=1 Tax=Haloarcula brevis TaxID=3111453 RepID=UPI00300F026D